MATNTHTHIYKQVNKYFRNTSFRDYICNVTDPQASGVFQFSLNGIYGYTPVGFGCILVLSEQHYKITHLQVLGVLPAAFQQTLGHKQELDSLTEAVYLLPITNHLLRNLSPALVDLITHCMKFRIILLMINLQSRAYPCILKSFTA